MRKRAIASSNPRRVRPKISRPCPGGFLSPLLGYSDLQLIPYAWPRFTSSRVCRREELISGRIQNEKQDAVNGTRFECWQQVATEERGLVLFFTRKIERSLQMRLVKTLWIWPVPSFYCYAIRSRNFPTDFEFVVQLFRPLVSRRIPSQCCRSGGGSLCVPWIDSVAIITRRFFFILCSGNQYKYQ